MKSIGEFDIVDELKMSQELKYISYVQKLNRMKFWSYFILTKSRFRRKKTGIKIQYSIWDELHSSETLLRLYDLLDKKKIKIQYF